MEETAGDNDTLRSLVCSVLPSHTLSSSSLTGSKLECTCKCGGLQPGPLGAPMGRPDQDLGTPEGRPISSRGAFTAQEMSQSPMYLTDDQIAAGLYGNVSNG